MPYGKMSYGKKTRKATQAPTTGGKKKSFPSPTHGANTVDGKPMKKK